MNTPDHVSIALLEHVGIDPKIVTGVKYEHTVGGWPVLTVELQVPRDGDLPKIETVEFEWRIKGEWREIVPGSPEWDEWLRGIPGSGDA